LIALVLDPTKIENPSVELLIEEVRSNKVAPYPSYRSLPKVQI